MPTNRTQASRSGNPGRSREAIWVRPETGSLAMPSDATEIPQFFESLEAMFRLFEIPADLRAKLLLPFLSLKAKSLIVI